MYTVTQKSYQTTCKALTAITYASTQPNLCTIQGEMLSAIDISFKRRHRPYKAQQTQISSKYTPGKSGVHRLDSPRFTIVLHMEIGHQTVMAATYFKFYFQIRGW
ncbi:hypothetical protein H2248_005524 [Termitomyces sp. 'cryptogamus']|nr:hypothetical protein H2248_005524 [Termitomyces sp. 'cryptogamus']